ncbi:MAG: DUF3553 domain-containing protein [Planctomycetota bacterium]
MSEPTSGKEAGVSSSVIEVKKGDRVRLATRPEWGHGEVLSVISTIVDNEPTRKVRIRFARAGVREVIDSPSLTHDEDGPVNMDPAALNERMTTLPQPLRDPLRSNADRFRETGAMFRFNGRGGSLIDWAATQTGLVDPLSALPRHEIEDAFARFRRSLEEHLWSLGRQMKQENEAEFRRIALQMPDDAQSVLRGRNARR